MMPSEIRGAGMGLLLLACRRAFESLLGNITIQLLPPWRLALPHHGYQTHHKRRLGRVAQVTRISVKQRQVAGLRDITAAGSLRRHEPAAAIDAAAPKSSAPGDTAARLGSSIADLEAATEWLGKELADGRQADALAGATPYQRLFGLVLTGAYLAKGALADAGDGRKAERAMLCRFAAENLIAETAALKAGVVSGASSLAAARAILG